MYEQFDQNYRLVVKRSGSTALAYLRSQFFRLAHQVCQTFDVKLDDAPNANDPNRTKKTKFHHQLVKEVNGLDADSFKISVQVHSYSLNRPVEVLRKSYLGRNRSNIADSRSRSRSAPRRK